MAYTRLRLATADNKLGKTYGILSLLDELLAINGFLVGWGNIVVNSLQRLPASNRQFQTHFYPEVPGKIQWASKLQHMHVKRRLVGKRNNHRSGRKTGI